MSSFQFTTDEDLQSERRLGDRRHLQDGKILGPSRVWRRRAGAAAALVALGLLVWQWRLVVYGPVWLARAHWADRSDLYIGATNGNPNRSLVEQARNYLTDIDHVDASGNLTAPETLRPLGVHLDIAWFRHHTPDRVDFDPFIYSGGRFVVTWLYLPGCQKAIWKSSRVDTDWYSLRGRPCYPLCSVSVLMDRDLKLTTIAINAVKS